MPARLGILLLPFLFCAPSALGQEETPSAGMLVSARSRLAQVGRPVDKVLDDAFYGAFKLIYGKRLLAPTEQIERVFREILEANGIQGLYPWRLHYVDDPLVNAAAFSYGRVYLFDGLIQRGLTEEELAGILAHEIAHVLRHHLRHKMQLLLGLSAIEPLAAWVEANLGVPGQARYALSAAEAFYFLHMTRDAERDADAMALRLLEPTTFRCLALSRALKKLSSGPESFADKIPVYLKTHPSIAERVEETRAYCAPR